MSEFTDYLVELFEGFGTVSARRMFGGYGLYHQGLMFALVADETLYLKTDAATKPTFVARGLPAFEYNKGSKQVRLSYFQAPEEALEDPDIATQWAQLAYSAALRQANPGKTR